MIRSMTAYASLSGGGGAWTWEIRGVNGRGLDLRLRIPDGIEGLEPAARAAVTARLGRGSITLSLRLAREDAGALIAVDPAQLAAALAAVQQVDAAAVALGLSLAPTSAAEILALRGVTVQAAPAADDTLLPALLAGLDALLSDFIAMRESEGRALALILAGQLDRITALVAEAGRLAEARRDEARAALVAALRRVFEEVPEADEARLAQELALIAVKQDVTEELHRLTAHVAAARDLIAAPQAAGRKLDFLAQEFNREANTLCSKAQSAALTRTGLDLKAVIDQMREQIQNVE